MPDDTRPERPPVEPHLRIPNRLFEAVIDSAMTDRQKVICFGLVRLTLGWGKLTASVALKDLAQASGQNYGGTFRDALNELTREGVIHLVQAGGGGATNSYRLATDYTQWGRFSVSPERLRRHFGERPDDADVLVKPLPIGGQTPTLDPAQARAGGLPTHGQGACPPIGKGTGDNSPDTNELEGRKDMKDRKDKEQQQQLAADPGLNDGEYARSLSTAANASITQRWGEQTRPIYFGQAYELVAELKAEAVPLSVAITAVADVCRKSKQSEAPKSINYFRLAILEANRSDVQRNLDRSAPRPDLGEQTRQHYADERANLDLKRHYDAERAHVANSWLEDPANAAGKAEIEAQADLVADCLPVGSFRTKSREKQIHIVAAERAGFPPFDVWLAARSPRQSTAQRG